MGTPRTFGAPGGGRTPRSDPGGGNGGGGESGFAFPVDTIARASASRLVDLDATLFPDGTLVFVRSVCDFFVLHKTSALTSDDITIADAIGGGRWLRKFTPSVRWLAQAAWFIDPAAADDEGDGSAGDPLQTHAELGRRAICQGREIKQTTTVTIVSTLPDDDPVEVDVKMPVPGTYLHYFGTPTTVRSGTFDGATSLISGTALPTVTDGVGGSFGAQIGKRLRMTSGPITGARAWLVRDDGGSTASTSAFFQQDTTSSPIESFPTLVDPDTDDYVVEDLPFIMLARVKATQAPVASRTPVIFEDLGVGGSTDVANLCTHMDSSLFVGCDVFSQVFDDAFGFYSGCRIAGNAQWFRSTASLAASAIMGSGYATLESFVELRNETTAVGTPLVPANSAESNYSVSDASGHDAGGGADGVNLGPGERCEVSGLLWGTGNAGYGIRARGGILWYGAATQPTITGTLGDTRIGGIDKVYAAIPFFNSSNNSGVVDTPT
jgi:hypothetical protein